MIPPDFLNYISIILTLGGIIGGIFAVRKGYFQESGAIQNQTISALKTRVETLESQAESDAKELSRLRQLIVTIRHALKRRGLHIEIDGEFVTLIDADGNQSEAHKYRQFRKCDQASCSQSPTKTMQVRSNYVIWTRLCDRPFRGRHESRKRYIRLSLSVPGERCDKNQTAHTRRSEDAQPSRHSYRKQL